MTVSKKSNQTSCHQFLLQYQIHYLNNFLKYDNNQFQRHRIKDPYNLNCQTYNNLRHTTISVSNTATSTHHNRSHITNIQSTEHLTAAAEQHLWHDSRTVEMNNSMHTTHQQSALEQTHLHCQQYRQNIQKQLRSQTQNQR